MSHMTTPQAAIIRVSVSEAARLFGVNARTVRRALAVGEITYIVVRGRYKINFESLVRWSQTKATLGVKRDKGGIGQYVEQWKIRNTLYSPNPKAINTNGDQKPPEEIKKQEPPQN